MPGKGIQEYHSFRFTTNDMGAVYVKERSNEEERLNRDIQIPVYTMPDEIPPAGPLCERQ